MTRDYSCKSDGVSIHSTALLNQEIAVEVASRVSYTANGLEYTWLSEKRHLLLRLESATWIIWFQFKRPVHCVIQSFPRGIKQHLRQQPRARFIRQKTMMTTMKLSKLYNVSVILYLFMPHFVDFTQGMLSFTYTQIEQRHQTLGSTGNSNKG